MRNIDPAVIDEEFIARVEKYRQRPEGVGLVEACSENPVLFVEHMIGVEPYVWQMEVLWAFKERLDNNSDYSDILLNTSRQIGKSTLLAWCALWAVIFNKRPDKTMGNTRVAIVSRGAQQAEKLVREVRFWMRNGDRFIRSRYVDENNKPLLGKNYFSDLLSPTEPNNAQTISIKDDSQVDSSIIAAGSKVSSWIKSFPPTPSVLGETFTIGMIDEAAHRDIPDEFISQELKPTGSANSAVWISSSTPWNANGWFYETMMDESGEVQKFVFSIDAIKDEPLGMNQYEYAQKDIETRKRNGDFTGINIVYYCRFEQAELQYFHPERVEEMFTKDFEMFESFDEPCDMGVDFGGQVNSRTVITIAYLNPESGVASRLYHKRYPVKEDGNLIDDMEELLTRFNVQRIIPDYCPAGIPFIKQMLEKGWNVQPNNEGMVYRRDKIAKYGSFRSKLNRGEIKSYVDTDLMGEMKGLEQSESSRQSNISAPRGGSDDMIDSFIQACYFFLDTETGSFGVIDYTSMDDNEEDPWASI